MTWTRLRRSGRSPAKPCVWPAAPRRHYCHSIFCLRTRPSRTWPSRPTTILKRGGLIRQISDRGRAPFTVRSDRVCEAVDEDDDGNQPDSRLADSSCLAPCAARPPVSDALCSGSPDEGRSAVSGACREPDSDPAARTPSHRRASRRCEDAKSLSSPTPGRWRPVSRRICKCIPTAIHCVRSSRWGYRRLQNVPVLRPNLNLDDLYLAILLASKKLNVRLRPELKPGESFASRSDCRARRSRQGSTEDDAGLAEFLCMELRNERPPQALLDDIITTVQDRFRGFEALALASVCERSKHTVALQQLPSIPGFAETPEAKVALARAWLRCWRDIRLLAERDAASLVAAAPLGGHEHPWPEGQVQCNGRA